MNKSTQTGLDPFINWAHNFGRSALTIIIIYMFAVPTIICTVFGCWPPVELFLAAAVPIWTLYWPLGVSEIFSYSPVLGSSSYLSFITGNVMNMKLPCAINAQKLAGTEPNTPEGDAVALLANCTSALTTLVVIIFGMLVMFPLQPILQSPFVQTATSYMLPALFGCLVLTSVKQDKGGAYWIKNKLLIGVVPFAICLFLFLTWSKASTYQGFLMIGAIVLCIAIARFLWKKGVVQVVTGLNGTPYEQ